MVHYLGDYILSFTIRFIPSVFQCSDHYEERSFSCPLPSVIFLFMEYILERLLNLFIWAFYVRSKCLWDDEIEWIDWELSSGVENIQVETAGLMIKVNI